MSHDACYDDTVQHMYILIQYLQTYQLTNVLMRFKKVLYFPSWHNYCLRTQPKFPQTVAYIHIDLKLHSDIYRTQLS